ncbi:hypothetical protein M752DRAFT_9482 [Aspergillus phoenicis ATCC 13157]|uniref:Uncharacterized protein n=1 Tax=Aspergillus phoenicis ATCC 13157 TaxID=1353007 RepID=A0A370Q0S9_ASPPH|nr:hypothetical protein M752DRAFT_9482 [Aspergillus phoenicis ATCC 13157]
MQVSKKYRCVARLVTGLLTGVIARAALGQNLVRVCFFFQGLALDLRPSLLGDDVDQAVGRSGSRRVLCTRAPGNEEKTTQMMVGEPTWRTKRGSDLRARSAGDEKKTMAAGCCRR